MAWHALLVGIDDYADDRLDVRGGVADVRAWWQTVRRLGIAAERVVVATSPKLSADGLGEAAAGVTFFAADRVGIEAARAEMAKRLAGGYGRALLAWTGHATASADGARRGTLLAASDSDPSDGGTLLPLIDVVSGLDEAVYGGAQDPAGADAGVVAFIDVCHAAAPAVAMGGADSLSTCGALALTATRAGEQAHVIEIGGERRGAFSWAVCTLLDRFGVEGGASRLTAADLYYRAREMLGVIDVRQRPTLFSVTGELDRRLLHGVGAGVLGAGAATVGAPLEIYPDLDGKVVRYEIRKPGDPSTLYGSFYVTGKGTKGGGWAPEREYWAWGDGHGFGGDPAAFELAYAAQDGPSMPFPKSTIRYVRGTFSPDEFDFVLKASYYEIARGGTTIGYARTTADSLILYSRSPQATLATQVHDTLEFTWQGSQAAHVDADLHCAVDTFES